MGRLNKKGMLLLLTGLIITLFAAIMFTLMLNQFRTRLRLTQGKILYNGNELTGKSRPTLSMIPPISFKNANGELWQVCFLDAANYR